MTKEPQPLVGAACDALRLVVERAGDNKEAFLDNMVLQDATLMRLQEAGEYLSRIRESWPEYYDSHQTQAWHNLIGLRNIIAHGYLQIDREKIWDIIRNDLPGLIKSLEALV